MFTTETVLLSLLTFAVGYAMGARDRRAQQEKWEQQEKILTRLLEESLYQGDALDEVCSKLGVRRISKP